MTYLSWFGAQTLLGKRAQKKLAGNTYLSRNGDDYVVTFYSTRIVTIHQDGTYALRAGSPLTVTTKRRIKQFCPARPYQKNFAWFIGDLPFRDGMRIDSTGQVVGYPDGIMNDLVVDLQTTLESGTGEQERIKAMLNARANEV